MSRPNTVGFRVHQLFRGVTGASSLDGSKSYPDRWSSEAMLQPQTNVENLSLESFCGRRKRRRRQHRPAYTIPENQISFATMNVQSLRLDLIAHRDKLRDLILRLREFKIHLCCLQEMHSFSSETLVDYVEEYCFVARGRVAVVLINMVWHRPGNRRVGNCCLDGPRIRIAS